MAREQKMVAKQLRNAGWRHQPFLADLYYPLFPYRLLQFFFLYVTPKYNSHTGSWNWSSIINHPSLLFCQNLSIIFELINKQKASFLFAAFRRIRFYFLLHLFNYLLFLGLFSILFDNALASLPFGAESFPQWNEPGHLLWFLCLEWEVWFKSDGGLEDVEGMLLLGVAEVLVFLHLFQFPSFDDVVNGCQG